MMNSSTHDEGKHSPGQSQQADAPGPLFHGWKIRQPLATEGAEADVFLISRESEQRILKLYRLGIQPKEEVFARLQHLSSMDGSVPEIARASVPEGQSLSGNSEAFSGLCEGVSPGKSDSGCFVRLFESGFDSETQRVFEIQEFFPSGNLKQRMSKKPLNADEIMVLLEQIHQALGKMHLNGILHLDLKPANLLIRSESPFAIAIADFGIASLLGEEFSKKMTDVKVTSLYQSPESLSGIVGFKSDWWSLGMMLLELLSGKHPFDGMQRQNIHYLLTTSEITIPDSLSPSWQELLGHLLVRNPERRWSQVEVGKWLSKKNPSRLFSQPGSASRDRSEHRTLSIPFSFLGKPFDTLESLIEMMSISPEAAEAAGKSIGDGALIGWLEQNKDYERSEQVFRILGKGEHPDVAFFRLQCFATPALTPTWHGRKLTGTFLEDLLHRSSVADPNEHDRRFLDYLFQDWFSKTLTQYRVEPPPEADRLFLLSRSLHQTEMGKQPISRRAMILYASFTGAFKRGRPLEHLGPAATRQKSLDNLFRVAGTEGFIPWARTAGVLDEQEAVLWRFLAACNRDGIQKKGARLFENLQGHEEKLVAALVSRDDLPKQLVDFLCGGEVKDEVFRFFLENRPAFPWMEEFFHERFQVKAGTEFDKFCRRYPLFLKIRKNQNELRERLVPPALAWALEQSSKAAVSPASVRTQMATHKLELFETIIENPSLLLRKGLYNLHDWGSLVKRLEGYLITIPPEFDARMAKLLPEILSDIEILEKGSRSLTEEEQARPNSPARSASAGGATAISGENLHETWARTGLVISLAACSTGLGAFPACLVFTISLFLSGHSRRMTANEARSRLTAARGILGKIPSQADARERS